MYVNLYKEQGYDEILVSKKLITDLSHIPIFNPKPFPKI